MDCNPRVGVVSIGLHSVRPFVLDSIVRMWHTFKRQQRRMLRTRMLLCIRTYLGHFVASFKIKSLRLTASQLNNQIIDSLDHSFDSSIGNIYVIYIILSYIIYLYYLYYDLYYTIELDFYTTHLHIIIIIMYIVATLEKADTFYLQSFLGTFQ